MLAARIVAGSWIASVAVLLFATGCEAPCTTTLDCESYAPYTGTTTTTGGTGAGGASTGGAAGSGGALGGGGAGGGSAATGGSGG